MPARQRVFKMRGPVTSDMASAPQLWPNQHDSNGPIFAESCACCCTKGTTALFSVIHAACLAAADATALMKPHSTAARSQDMLTPLHVTVAQLTEHQPATCCSSLACSLHNQTCSQSNRLVQVCLALHCRQSAGRAEQPQLALPLLPAPTSPGPAVPPEAPPPHQPPAWYCR